jgi:prefoldin beta subunit
MEKEEASHLFSQAQLYSQQMQNILAQRTAMVLELNEIKKSLEELGKTKEKSVYRLSGPIMIKADTAAVKKDLEEKQNTISLRVKTLEKQEERLKERIEELRGKIIKVKASSEAG